MNDHDRRMAYAELEKMAVAAITKEEIDRVVQMALEIEQKHIEYLEELIEENAPDYNMMDLETIQWTLTK